MAFVFRSCKTKEEEFYNDTPIRFDGFASYHLSIRVDRLGIPDLFYPLLS